MFGKMKKWLAVLAACLFAVCSFGCLTGCGGGSGAKKGELLIRYFQGGYGDQWLRNAAKKFEERHEGVTVKWEGDTQIGDLMVNQLSTGKNLADIYIPNEANWHEFVSHGYLASLDDVFDTEITLKSGEKIKVKDYMLDDLSDRCYASRYEGAKVHPYIMPHGFQQAGIVYNEDILLATEHTTAKAGEGGWSIGDKWTAPPETVEDLIAYCTDLNVRSITPLAFPGLENMWLQRLMYGWWGQYQGAYELNTANNDVTANEGTYFDFWNYKSAEVFNQAGIRAAIDAFQKVFVDLDKSIYKNVSQSVMTYSVQDAERVFAEQKCAMVVCGSFIYNELGTLRDSNNDGNDDFTMKMMHLPFVTGAQCDTDGNPIRMNFYNCEDMMFIPKDATNLDLAKEFLVLLAEEESLVDFTECSGTLRPYKYNPNLNEFSYSPFAQSTITNYNETEVKLIRYPSGVALEEVSPMYSYVEPKWDDANKYFVSALTNKSASNILKTIYDGAKGEWATWQLKAS